MQRWCGSPGSDSTPPRCARCWPGSAGSRPRSPTGRRPSTSRSTAPAASWSRARRSQTPCGICGCARGRAIWSTSPVSPCAPACTRGGCSSTGPLSPAPGGCATATGCGSRPARITPSPSRCTACPSPAAGRPTRSTSSAASRVSTSPSRAGSRGRWHRAHSTPPARRSCRTRSRSHSTTAPGPAGRPCECSRSCGGCTRPRPSSSSASWPGTSRA